MADVAVPVEGSAAAETDPKKHERSPKFGDYIRIFTYAKKWDFVVYVIATLASIGAGITMPLMNVIFGKLVGEFTDYFKPTSKTSTGDFRGILNKQALYIMALFFARWGLNAINKFCFRMIGIRLSSAVRLHYLQSLLSQSIHVIDSMPHGSAATAITVTSNTMQLGISERLATFLQFNATIYSAIIIAFTWSWQLTLVTSSVLVFMIIVLSLTIPFFVKATNSAGEADSHSTAIATEALEGIRLVMACGAQSRIISQYEKWAKESMRRSQRMAPSVGLQLGLVFFGMIGAFGLSFWYGTQRYIDGSMSNVGTIVVVLMSVMLVLNSMERIATPMIAVSNAMIAACELFTVIDAPLPESGTLKPDITSEDLIFDNVTFEYPSRPGVRVLDGLSFRIESGKNTALVGPSGSGKSTIVGLLERWYSLKTQCSLPKVLTKKEEAHNSEEEKSDQPDQNTEKPSEPKLSGSIMAGSNNLEDINLQWWRAQIGLVQQEPFLFSGTIFNNVCNGLIGTEWANGTEEKKRELVEEACKEAYAHDFISRLPEGYDTQVGEGGVKLSGGQKQRLAIARSIVKKPQIIILDEATSAIDAKSEKLVQAALDRVTEKRTTITIAHRLSTIKKADRIIVLKRGHAVEQGTHESLMSDPSGVYSGLVRAQSLNLPVTEETESEMATTEQEFESEAPAKDVEQAADTAQSTESPQESTAKKPRGATRVLGQLLYRQRSRWPLHLGILISTMAIGAGTPIQAWLFSKVLGVFLLTGDEIERKADFWGLMWFTLASSVGFSYMCASWMSILIQYFGSASHKLEYFTAMLYQKLGFFDQDGNSHGTLSSQISSDAKHLEEVFGLNSAFVLSGIFNVIGCITISLVFSWKLGLVAMFVTMPIMLGSGFWKFRHEMQFDKMNSAVFAESSQFATEAIGAIRTVSALTMETTINSRYQQLLDSHVQDALRKAQWTCLFFGFADSVSLGCQALIFWYGGGLLANGKISMEAFFVCFMGMIQGAEAASQVLALSPNAAQASRAANRIFEMQESAEMEESKTEDEKAKTIPDTDGGVEIELKDVHFKYPTRDVPVFQGLNLTIQKGQFAAFVGPSGCGKTTIISLLERFYDPVPDHGSIFCNGTNIHHLDVYDYRQNLSLVSQEPTLFRGTIRDNILFGIADPDSVSEDRIQEVCREAFIHDFIVSLPNGYSTEVGHKGVSMSGGQKQRVAIARALIRDPKILLLDEATSALDSESEKVVQAAFDKARNGRTMIAVAHRLSTIQDADVIFVFDEGRVVEKGTHSELVKKQGVYWEMCQSQALDQ